MSYLSRAARSGILIRYRQAVFIDSRLKHRIQAACPLQRVQLVAATDVLITNPYLRDRSSSSLRRHFRAQRRLTVDRNFFVADAFAIKQALGPEADSNGKKK